MDDPAVVVADEVESSSIVYDPPANDVVGVGVGVGAGDITTSIPGARSATTTATATAISRTVVNGIGQWNNWARNFQTSLLAFLDLLDNAVDAVDIEAHHRAAAAATTNTTTAVAGRPLAYIDIDSQRDGDVSLINTCAKPIPAMDKILELYSSKKVDTQFIGENGIGLKQGCACLSDLSFVCTKSEASFQLGVIAKVLQTETQVLLPSLEFTSGDGKTIRAELWAWVQDHAEIRQAVQQYGDNGDLDDAIDRLEHNFTTLRDGYPEHPHVYGLFLHQVKQGKGGSGSDRSGGLLDELTEDLPHRYLHIPNTVIVSVRADRVQFSYWQSRLVEMAHFRLCVHPSVWMRDDPFWNLGTTAFQQKIFRLYIGFDALRVVDRNLDSNPHLYIYSRSSGRKIVCHKDARNALELGSSSGSDYSQGLTILLDDCQTSLPLNPTKQDTAFAESSTGEIFKKNLFMWIRAAMRVYYDRYWGYLYHKKKTPLAEALRALAPAIRAFDPSTLTKSMAESHYGSFGNFASKVVGDSIRLVNNASKAYHPGTDILFRLPGEATVVPTSRPLKRKSIVTAAAATTASDASDDDELNNYSSRKKPPGRQRHAAFADAATMVQPLPAPTSSQYFPLGRGRGGGGAVYGVDNNSSRTLVDANSLQLIQRRAARYEQMKIKKRAAEDQVVELRKQLASAKDDNALAGQRERMAHDRVRALERELVEERAQGAERTAQYESDLLDRDDEIIRLTTQAAYWKKSRDDLLAAQNDDDDDSSDDDDQQQEATAGTA